MEDTLWVVGKEHYTHNSGLHLTSPLVGVYICMLVDETSVGINVTYACM